MDISKSIVESDPINLMFELNEELLKRISRMKYIFDYSYISGVIIFAIAFPFFVTITILAITQVPVKDALVWMTILFSISIFSLLAALFSYKEVRFLDEFALGFETVKRASEWQPQPRIPEGSSHVDRFVNHLSDSDRRFNYYYSKNPALLRKDSFIKGKSGNAYHVDAAFIGKWCI